MQLKTWFGTFTITDNEIVNYELVKKDVTALVEHLLSKDTDTDTTSTTNINLRDLAKKSGFVEDDEEYNALLHKVCLQLAKKQVSQSYGTDKKIIQAISALDELDKVSNILAERLKEWYGLHFPELDLITEDLAKFVATYGSRNNINNSDESIYTKAKESIGIDFTDTDEEIIQHFAKILLELYKCRDSLKAYITENISKIAPNLTNITGALLGTRLLSIAGSLEKLAVMPSSRIQVLGANKALFKHLHGRAPSPKHGVIFQHPLINSAPWWQRGKIARTLASTIALASRLDYYSGVIKEDLELELNNKINKIKEKYPNPPEKKSKKRKRKRKN